MPKITLKLNQDIKDLKSGSLKEVLTDQDGVIVDRFWRNRLQDAVLDNCVEVLQPKKAEAVQKDKGK